MGCLWSVWTVCLSKYFSVADIRKPIIVWTLTRIYLFCRLWLIHVVRIMCMHILIEEMFKRLSMPMSPSFNMIGKHVVMSSESGMIALQPFFQFCMNSSVMALEFGFSGKIFISPFYIAIFVNTCNRHILFLCLIILFIPYTPSAKYILNFWTSMFK